ncbi:MAG TPA: hypothetical protein GXX40_09560 [Firmicutes bacterium]|nr:hypothetical protein [Bacillota bacterium]
MKPRKAVLGLNLDLLNPQIYSQVEIEAKKRQWVQLVLLCASLAIWTMALISWWKLRVVTAEFKYQQAEKAVLVARMPKQREAITPDPEDVRKAREELAAQPDWYARFSAVSAALPTGCELTQVALRKDGTLELAGKAQDAPSYGLLLSKLRGLDFVKNLVTAYFTSSKDGGYAFKVTIATSGTPGGATKQ